MNRIRLPERGSTGGDQLPESPRGPMEFLSRSWSASALKVSKALARPTPPSPLALPLLPKAPSSSSSSIPEEKEEDINGGETDDQEINGNNNNNNNNSSSSLSSSSGHTFSFASSTTSQLVLERIMSQSEVSPLTSGRLSHSSGPLNGSLTEETESPPLSLSLSLSPSLDQEDQYDDVLKYLRANNSLQPLFAGKHGGHGGGGGGGGISTPGGKTVGRWLKERREKKKEETRAHNAQLHAAVSVAGVAAAVAAIAAATSASGKDEQLSRTEMAVASAATLVAAQCVEAAEAMGAEREHLAAAISSAVNVRSHGDIMTLTAAAATALRGAATLKARALKEVWNIAAVIPVVDKGMSTMKVPPATPNSNNHHANATTYIEEEEEEEQLVPQENFLGVCNQEFLARGFDLLKRTRKGDLHWKIVSVYIHRTGQVMLKMKSKHVAGAITKKKKNVVVEVCKDVQAWPGRHLFEDGEKRRYFGLRTATNRVIEFECKNQRDYDMWTQGVSRLLSIVEEQKNRGRRVTN